MFALLLKEVPYLVLMIVGALNQVPVARHLAIARALGYRPAVAWFKVILPQVYPQVRLPVYAVLAFSLSVVDVALILAPGNPPPLAVLAVRWFADADLRWYFPAAAAACLQLAIVAGAIALWHALERATARVTRGALSSGRRGGPVARAAALLALACAVLFLLAVAAIVGMALWSFAAQWRFPDALPQAWSLANWGRRAGELARPLLQTLAVALVATALALLLVLACLENEARQPQRPGPKAMWLLYLPLLVPQIAFLFGAQVLLVRLAWDGTLLAVVWAHLVFVLPYLFLSLADPWRALDPRFARTAASLGASPARVFLRVKLPILLRPILIACAVGFAVSVGLYLPTLFAGNGRFATLTTEAVTLAAGADRRVIGAYALAQAAFPLLVYRRGRGRASARARPATRHGALGMTPPPRLPLRLEGVRIELAQRELVPPLDLAIAPGECVTVMGPSGCGKSTLLAMIAGTLDAAFRASGRVRVGERRPHAPAAGAPADRHPVPGRPPVSSPVDRREPRVRAAAGGAGARAAPRPGRARTRRGGPAGVRGPRPGDAVGRPARARGADAHAAVGAAGAAARRALQPPRRPAARRLPALRVRARGRAGAADAAGDARSRRRARRRPGGHAGRIAGARRREARSRAATDSDRPSGYHGANQRGPPVARRRRGRHRAGRLAADRRPPPGIAAGPRCRRAPAVAR